jgi:MarR family transcriptional regulator for hemolysin
MVRMTDKWTEGSIGRQLALTSKAARAFHAARLAEAGCTFGVWTVLASLNAHGPMIQRALAELMAIESPTLTRYLAQMETDGLIVRQRSTDDRRAATVALTDTGRARYRALESIALDGHRQLLRGFTDTEAEQLADMLTRIQHNVTTTAPTDTDKNP